MESDLILYSVNAIRSMEVVDISTGSKLGYISDFKIDLDTNKIVKGKNYETSKKNSSNYAYIGFININDTNNKCKCGKESKTK